MNLAGLVVLAALAAPKSEILGIWKGTSTCTKVEGNELCRDETVVYNVVDIPDQPATVTLKAARVVDGTVQPLYSLYFTYRPETGEWTSAVERTRASGTWAYVVRGDEMTGTATVLPKGTVVRRVVVKRAAKDEVAGP